MTVLPRSSSHQHQKEVFPVLFYLPRDLVNVIEQVKTNPKTLSRLGTTSPMPTST